MRQAGSEFTEARTGMTHKKVNNNKKQTRDPSGDSLCGNDGLADEFFLFAVRLTDKEDAAAKFICYLLIR